MDSRLTIMLVVALLSFSCKKKGEKDDDGASASPTVASTTTATPPEGSLSVTLEGVPLAVSSMDTIEVTVNSKGGDFYRFELLHGASDCSSAEYGTWYSVDKVIKEDLGDDGEKILCVIVRSNSEAVNVSATSYRWVKDSIAPMGTIHSLASFGPHHTMGAMTTLAGQVSDSLTSVVGTTVSIQKSGGACLNDAGSVFNAACPQKLAASLADGSWSLSIGDGAFESNTTYVVTVYPMDEAGNEGTVSVSAVWDTTAPGTPGSLAIAQGEEQLTLSWVAASGATKYVVVRRIGSATTSVPVAGVTYESGELLDASHAIAYVGSATSFIDDGLLPYEFYYYAVYGLDDALNVGGAVAGNGLTAERPRFRGIQYAAVVADDKTIRVEWQPFAPQGVDPSLMTYELYAATTSGGQNFTAAPQASVVGGQSLYYRYTDTQPNVYLVVRARAPSGEIDLNSNEMVVTFSGTAHHKIGSNGRLLGHAPLSAYLDNAWAVTKDIWGNFIFSGDSGIVHVYCRENTAAPYCKLRTVERIYTLAGTDGIANGLNDVPASRTAMGLIYGISVDSAGNVFLADASNFVIRALCYAPLQAGFCFTKSPGHHYIVSGSGVSGDGGHDVSAATASLGIPNAVALNSSGDIIVGDSGFRRIRIICQQNTTGYCAGKTVGNTYRFQGTGVNADGADDTVASTTLGTGDIGAMAVDALDNLYWSDTNYRRVRVVCFNVGATAGFCNGKTAGKHYRIMGTGAAANGGDDVLASTAGIGQSFGIALDAQKNIYVSDLTYPRVRVIWQSTASVFCAYKAVGNVYHYAGTGVNTVSGADGVHIALAGLGDSRGIAMDEAGNIVISDSRYKYLRVLCANDDAGTLCAGRLPSYHHLVVGSGNATGGSEYASAINTPLGTLQATTIDPNGNVYVSDSANFRVRVICYNTTAAGICQGKTFGYNYFAAGTGVTGDGANGSALIRAVGVVNGLASDDSGNIYMADTTYFRVRVLCNDTVAAGFCSGKVKGSTYRLAGTGVTGDGADNAVAATTAMGAPYGVALDSFGNVFVADSGYRRVRALCLSNAGGFCAGKTVNNSYQLAGTGVAGDGNSGAPGVTAMGTLTSIALDATNNVYVGDSQYFRVRAICYDVSAAAGFCNGKTTNTMYRVAGTGVTGNGADDAVAASTAHGVPSALAVDAYGNVFMADHTYFYIRALCFDVTSAGHCQGKISGSTYRLLGTGVTGESASHVLGATAGLGNTGYGGLSFTSNGHLLRTDSFNSLRLFFKP